MAGLTNVKKRPREEFKKGKGARPFKKPRKQAYHSSDDDSDGSDSVDASQGLHMLSDDEDLDAKVHDDSDLGSGSDSGSGSEVESKNIRAKKPEKPKQKQKKDFVAKDAPESDNDESEDSDLELDDDEYDLSEDGSQNGRPTKKIKRNDEAAFATAMSKILSSKISVSKRADPIVARSAAAHKSGEAAIDAALEAKARRRLREQKRLALEKGRVKDVLIPSTTKTLDVSTGRVEEKVDNEAETTSQILAVEKRLRKVAQRGVVQLFNAVRAAQVKATEAERLVKQGGVVGMDRKKRTVTEMSKKGFLELLASGGGGLKKGALEEA